MPSLLYYLSQIQHSWSACQGSPDQLSTPQERAESLLWYSQGELIDCLFDVICLCCSYRSSHSTGRRNWRNSPTPTTSQHWKLWVCTDPHCFYSHYTLCRQSGKKNTVDALLCTDLSEVLVTDAAKTYKGEPFIQRNELKYIFFSLSSTWSSIRDQVALAPILLRIPRA